MEGAAANSDVTGCRWLRSQVCEGGRHKRKMWYEFLAQAGSNPVPDEVMSRE